jgi:hypothetical protein
MKLIEIKVLFVSAVLCFALTKEAFAQASELILSVHEKVGEKIVSKIELFTNRIDPNMGSITDEYRITINGNAISVPKRLLAELDHSRREFSYDENSEGIRSYNSYDWRGCSGVLFEAAGAILYVRYLTYGGPNHFDIVSSEMKPVYSEKLNCRFSEGYAPTNMDAKIAAAKSLSALRTIMAIMKN